MYVALVSNGANVLLNWLLIFRLGRGFSARPVATSLCRWVQLALLLAYLALWPAERSRETRPKAILPGARLRGACAVFAALAGPGAAMMLIEAWSFEMTTLLAGYLGVVALDAHLTMLQLATLAFLSLPFATAIASTIRVGNLLGGGDGAAARTAAATTLAMCAAFTAVCGAVFAGAANHLGKIFTDDRDVIRATAVKSRTSPRCFSSRTARKRRRGACSAAWEGRGRWRGAIFSDSGCSASPSAPCSPSSRARGSPVCGGDSSWDYPPPPPSAWWTYRACVGTRRRSKPPRGAEAGGRRGGEGRGEPEDNEGERRRRRRRAFERSERDGRGGGKGTDADRT